MRKLLTNFVLIFVLLGAAFAQGGPYPSPSFTWFNVPMSANITPNGSTTWAQYSRQLFAPLYGNGVVQLTVTGLTGSPASCQVYVTLGGQTQNNSGTQPEMNTAAFTPTNGQSNFRLTQFSINPVGAWSAIAFGWTCVTFPTGGTMNVEFIPDPPAASIFNYFHIFTNVSQVVKTQPAFLHSVTINNIGSAETLTIFDNNACSGTAIAVVTASAQTTLLFDVQTTVGLCATTAGTTAGDFTVSYR